jgi:DNA-binding NarL/FixJ family response regulator
LVLMFKLFNIRWLLLYGMGAGLTIALAAAFRNRWYYSGSHPDLFLTLVAATFCVGGLWLGRMAKRKEMITVEVETDQAGLLSKREKEVHGLLLAGKSNKAIAMQLCVELSTVKTHINTIYRKLGVGSRKELQLKFQTQRSATL